MSVRGVEGDAQVRGHYFCLGIIVKLKEEHPLGLALVVVGELLGIVVAFVICALSHKLVGREVVKAGMCSGRGGCRGGRR
jgi:hypothetical protein